MTNSTESLPPVPAKTSQIVTVSWTRVLAPLTVEKQRFQSLQELSTLIQLLLEALGHTVIHVAGLQQLLKRLNHGVHVLTVHDTDAVAVLNLLPLKGQLPGLGLN